MNRNRQLSNVYWRNAKPYLNWQSTQPSVNSTNQWTSFKSNTGNFTFQREPGWMQRPVAVWICLRGRTLTQFPTIPCNLQMANWSDSISQTGQCKTRTAECEQQTECKKSAVLILHFTLSLHFTPGPHSAFYTHHLSNFPRKQLDTHEPSVLNIYMGKPEIPVEKNKMVRVNPFEKLHKKGCVNWGNAIFLLFLVCSAYLDIHCSSGSFSHHVKFYN